MHSHSLFLKIRFFLLIRRRELSNSISLQKCFHQIKIPFRLNNEAHMTARNIVNLRIQFPEQICEPFLIFLFENVIFREEDQYPPPQIFKIICSERRVILQHIYTPEAMDALSAKKHRQFSNRCHPARCAECFFSYTTAAMHQRMNCFDSSFFIFFASCS